jgi:predicted outer membrane repeat protein
MYNKTYFKCELINNYVDIMISEWPFKNRLQLALGILISLALILSPFGVSRVKGSGLCYVNLSASGANDGTSWGNAYQGLQDALEDVDCSEIWVAAGTYYPTSGTERGESFTLRINLAIYGGFAGTEIEREERDIDNYPTILSGDIGNMGDDSDNSFNVIYADDIDTPGVVLDGFTITGGNANGSGRTSGGGLYSENSSLTLENVVFFNNSASQSGGGMRNRILSQARNPTLINVSFIGNVSRLANGGGMFNNNSRPVLNTVTFINNSARRGGGMYNGGNVPELSDVVFEGNSAEYDGGGVYNTSSSPVLENVTFHDNSAAYGAGMFNTSSSHPELKSVNFTGNTASVRGGGIYNSQSSPNLFNVVFDDNSALNGGGGLYNSTSSSPLLNHVTFNNNRSNNGGGLNNASVSNPTLTNVSFLNNAATVNGGGLYNTSSNPTLTNVTFSGNTAITTDGDGGGVYNINSNLSLTNVTFKDNQAARDGGGIFNHNSIVVGINSIFWDNLARSGAEQIWNSGTTTLTIENSVVEGGYSGGAEIIADDPLLGTLGDNGGYTQTIPIAANSPARSQGKSLACPSSDQRGVVRVTPCDIGAYEVDPPIVITQIYGGGGNSGAPYNSDFVVLFNPSGTSYNIGGWSIQYASATRTGNFGSTASMISILPSFDLQPGQYFLVKLREGTTGDPLPAADHTGSINLSASDGKVGLVSDSLSLGCNGGSTPCNPGQLARIVDLIGYGNADFYEGSGAAPKLTNSTAGFRENGGCQDTDDNADDFYADTPDPLNSASPFNSCILLPSVVISSTASDPTNTSPIPVVITFSESVTGFEISDLEVGNGTAANFNGSDDVYTVDITPDAEGLVTVDVPADSAFDGFGSGNTAADQFSITYDSTPPEVTSITSNSSDPTNTSPVPITIIFSEPVTGFDLVDIAVINGTASDLVGSGSTYAVEITPTSDGLVTVSIPAGGVSDLAGNNNLESAPLTITYDSTPPSVSVNQAAAQPDPTNVSPIFFTAVFSEPIDTTTFTAADIAISGTAGADTVAITEVAPMDGTSFQIAVSGMVDSGTVIASVPAGGVEDLAGNTNTASISTDNTVTYDIDYPVVTAIRRANASPTNNDIVNYQVLFSKPVMGITLADFILETEDISGAVISGLSGSGDSYQVQISTGAGSGTLRLDLVDDDSITDLLGSPLGGAGAGNGDFSGETYVIDRTAGLFSGGLIVNETSNGSSGNKEWMELIVVGPGDSVDLSGWIIDDNNGDFDSLASGKGIASGHLRFADPMPACTTGQSLAAAPVGARIIVYNADDVEAPLDSYPNDPCDSDGDGVYYLPVGASINTTHLQQCTDRPRVSPLPMTADYNGCDYSTPDVTWAGLQLANTGDVAQVRQPTGQFFHGFAYGNLSVPPAPNFPDGTPAFNVDTSSGTNKAYRFSCGNYFSNASGQFFSAD